MILLGAGMARANPVLLVEADTGRVLEQQDAGKAWYPASVTKLMTVYVALNAVRTGRLTMDSPLTVSALAASQQPTKMGFRPGTVVTLDNALKMLMVKSANDMAIVIAEGVGGSMPAFVAEMNATAAHLGMSGTHYENPNGLPDPGQITTARDLAILARALIYHFPEHEMLFHISAIRIGKRVLRNYNRLIDRYPGADGMKTGFVCGSGYNLVATATRGNKRLIAIILGASSGRARTEEAALLLEKGFQGSWGIFGAAAPTVSSIQNVGGAPFDMKPYVCGGKKLETASEDDDSPSGVTANAISFALAAGGPTAPRSGADLLQNLPPSMAPIPVYVGTRAAPLDPDTAVANDDAPKKKKTASTAGAKEPGAKAAGAKSNTKNGAKTASASGEPKPTAKPQVNPQVKPQVKPQAKPQVKPSKPATASVAAKPKPAAKPAPKPSDDSASDAAEPAPHAAD